MKRLALVALALGACGGGLAAEGEIAAATFLVDVDAADLEVVGRDRLAAGSGDEDRLDVLRPTPDAEIRSLYRSTPMPNPFEFVRDPLSAGGVDVFLESADRIVAVVYPLIDSTPGGRVLAATLVALDSEGEVVATDWDDDSDAAVAALVDWGAAQGFDVLETLELAFRGLGGDESVPAQTAADFFR